MTEPILSLLGMEKLLKRAGAQRVGEDAKQELLEALERYADQLAAKSVSYSVHAKRRTVKAEDVKLALQE